WTTCAALFIMRAGASCAVRPRSKAGSVKRHPAGGYEMLPGKTASRRTLFGIIAATVAAAGLTLAAAPASAQQGEPIKIGFSMSLTGPLAPNGKQALVGMKIWEEEINAKGGLLGRPVKLIFYDDQSQSAPVPGIYTKLMDVDKVDLVIGPYATVPSAAAMPV